MIAPRWVLTAAHVAAGADRANLEVVLGGRSYAIQRAIVHPQWRELGPHDVGLLVLAEPVAGIAPVALYEGADEAGRVAILVGHGDTRTGLGGPWVRDGHVRGATSLVESTDDARLVFRFRAPPDGTELEGAPGRGDSGGPALLEIAGAVFVAGVSSAGFDGEHGPGTYGAVDHFTRVSTHVRWIREVMQGGAPSAPQQAAPLRLPETPAGRQAAVLLELLRGDGGDDAVRAFFRERVAPEFRDGFPMDVHLSQFRMLRRDLGGAEVREVDTQGPHAIRLSLRNREGAVFRLDVEVEPAPPHRLAGLGMAASPGPARGGGGRGGAPAAEQLPSDDALVARVVRLADSLAAADRFSGVILIARGDKPILERAWGLADRERRIPAAVDTRFNLGSINKIFTAAAIHRLARDGRLRLDDTLGTHLPDYPNADARRQVTIAQLLDHTSGIGGNIFRAPHGGTRDDLRATADFVALFASEPLQFPPGTQSRYSNAGYVLLGAVIERATGQSYYDFVSEHVYQPLGMASTGHHHRMSLPEGTAIGYTRGGPGAAATGPLQSNHDRLPGRGSAAGGGYSTARDLLRFAVAAQRGDLPGVRGGLGIGGGAPGINAALEAGLPGGYHVVVLANMDPPVAEDIAERIREWLPRT